MKDEYLLLGKLTNIGMKIAGNKKFRRAKF